MSAPKTLTLGGKEYTLRLGNNAISEVECKVGQLMGDRRPCPIAMVLTGGISATTAQAILWAGIKYGMAESLRRTAPTYEAVGDLMDAVEDADTLKAELQDALLDALPSAAKKKAAAAATQTETTETEDQPSPETGSSGQ
jgi:hypothetical protein